MKESVYLAGHSHIDLSWLWPKGETIYEICPRTFRSSLDLMKKYPFLRFSQSSAQISEWMDKYLLKTEYKIEGNSVTVPIKAWEIKTLRIKYSC